MQFFCRLHSKEVHEIADATADCRNVIIIRLPKITHIIDAGTSKGSAYQRSSIWDVIPLQP